MSALLLVCAVLAQAPSRVEAEAAFAFGSGSRSAFGALLAGSARWPLYELSAARGELEAGLLAGYQNEPSGPSAQYALPSVVTGSNHRVEVFATVGHTLSLLESRRLELGLLGFAGWTHLSMRGALRNEALGIERSFAADASEFTFGLALRAGFQLTPRLSLVARFVLPVPYAGVAVSSYFVASLGLALRL